MTNDPTPGDLLLMFETLALEYEAFDEMMPQMTEFRMGVPREPSEHRGNQVRVMLLRKFITQADTVYLPRIYDAILSCSAPEYREQTQKNVASAKTDFANARTSKTSYVVGFDEEQTVYGEHDIYYDLKYGRLLHAEFARWSRLERMPDLYMEMALWDAYGPFDHLVKEARVTVTEGRSKGRLMVPQRIRPIQFPED
jgi:hypothetical protein